MSYQPTIRTLMLQRAAHLAASVNSEDAWHLISLYEKSNPGKFHSVIHLILANFLDLHHDYFNEAEWPLKTQMYCIIKTELDESSSESDAETCQITNVQTNENNKRNISNRLRMKLSKNFTLLPEKFEIENHFNGHPAFRINDFSTVDTKKRPTNNMMKPFYNLAKHIIDYMTTNNSVYTAEGLFRRPGNQTRVKQGLEALLNKMNNTTPSYQRMAEPCPMFDDFDSEFETFTPEKPIKNQIDEILETLSPHDCASLLLKCITKCSTFKTENGLLPIQITELLTMATDLQKSLDHSKNEEDWTHILCHARQLLTYRIAVQLLTPKPERKLLVKCLELFNKVAKNSKQTMMSAESIATCTAQAFFGMEENSEDTKVSVKLRINTLKNLIECSNELNSLPGVVYQMVKSILRAKHGRSPAQEVGENVEIKENITPVPKPVYRSSSIDTTDCSQQPKFKQAKFTYTTNSGERSNVSKFINVFQSWRKTRNPVNKSNDDIKPTMRKAKSYLSLKRKL